MTFASSSIRSNSGTSGANRPRSPASPSMIFWTCW
jgi:hypothetical protein